ncbi:MAG: hypothetical protein U0175_35410 [Caldilineaceae bacterium]
MGVVRRIAVGLVGVILVFTVAACQSASATEITQTVSSSATPTPQQPGDVVWGRVAYCNCFADSATTNVANALKNAHLNVSLKELSPSKGWLYFAVTFDPQSTTQEQVSVAMKAGGAEILDGPP